jgi:septal ring factor EnvC (AmiA/AmiB activator)
MKPRISFTDAPWIRWAVVALMFLVTATGTAFAQRRGSTSRARQMMAAQRQHEIEQLQKQIEESQKLLDSLTTQGVLTQAQLEAARQSAISTRTALNATEERDQEIHKKIRGIEDGIIESQSDDSAFARAADKVNDARHDLDAELHRTLRHPPPAPDEDEVERLSELAHLTAEERAALAASPRYTEKKAVLQQAMNELIAVRMGLFEASDEWKKAKEEHHQIEQELAEKKRSIRGAAADSSDAREGLRSVEDVAASARASIAQARARLRALGGQEKPATTPEKPKTGAKN